MVSEIVEILHELNIVDYNIYDEHRKAFEMYFVKHRLDMTRDKEVREIRLRVYRNFEENGTEYLGNSDVYLYPGMDGDEIRELIESAWESALYVKNPYYRLPEKVIDKNTEKVFDSSVISSPSSRILPDVGVTIPAIIFASVDFPPPLGPVIAVNLPSILRLISLIISLSLPSSST